MPADVTGEYPVRPPRNILARPWSEHQVDMIGHEAGSKNVDRDVRLRFGDQRNK